MSYSVCGVELGGTVVARRSAPKTAPAAVQPVTPQAAATSANLAVQHASVAVRVANKSVAAANTAATNAATKVAVANTTQAPADKVAAARALQQASMAAAKANADKTGALIASNRAAAAVAHAQNITVAVRRGGISVPSVVTSTVMPADAPPDAPPPGDGDIQPPEHHVFPDGVPAPALVHQPGLLDNLPKGFVPAAAGFGLLWLLFL